MSINKLFNLFNALLDALDAGGHGQECPLRCVTGDCDHEHFCAVCDLELL